MKTVTKNYEVYEYTELSERAKEKAKRDYLQFNFNFAAEYFTEDCLTVLNERYPNSELKVQWDVSGCQGDGVNIYGTFNLKDFGYSGKSDIDWILTNCKEITLEENKKYAYSLKDFDNQRRYAVDEIATNIENSTIFKISNAGIEIITDFVNCLFDELEELERQFYDAGDEQINDVSNEIMIELSETNEWYYLENGELFV